MILLQRHTITKIFSICATLHLFIYVADSKKTNMAIKTSLKGKIHPQIKTLFKVTFI